jgi:deoxyribose-phosphate aldolase
MTREELARLIDQTLLRAVHGEQEFRQFVAEALECGFGQICVAGSQIAKLKEMIAGRDVRIDGVAGFPLGTEAIATKGAEARMNLLAGADEIDFVVNPIAVASEDYGYVLKEFKAMRAACRRHVCKVILETCHWSRDQKRRLCDLAVQAGLDFVKTSTGLATPPEGRVSGATVEDVQLMRQTVGDRCGVKAAGGIRTYEQAAALIEAGANRIGTSSGAAILAGCP